MTGIDNTRGGTRELVARRMAVSGVFLGAGIALGAWGTCLPLIKRGLALSDGELGLALLCLALGAVTVMPLVGRMATRFGVGRLCSVSGCGFAVALMATPHAMGLPVLAACIFAMGVGFGTLDVAMNMLAAAVERQRGEPIMSSFHAAFSIGLLGSAALCAGLFSLGLGAEGTLFATGVIVFGLMAGSAPWTAATAPPENWRSPSPPWWLLLRDPMALGLGGLVFLGFIVEGAMTDWTAVYAVQQAGLSEGAGAAAFALFAAAMALGRMAGNNVERRLGPSRLVGLGCGLAIAGLATAAAFPRGSVVMPAFTLVGIGIANIVPVLYSTVGRRSGERSAQVFPFVVGIGYVGVLVGPPLIGAVAEQFSLRGSLLVLVAALVIIVLRRRQVA